MIKFGNLEIKINQDIEKRISLIRMLRGVVLPVRLMPGS